MNEWKEVVSGTGMSIDELLDAYHAALQAQAAANAAEMQAKETCKVVMAGQQIAAGDVAVAKAEIIARASPSYKDTLRSLFSTTEAAETARGEVEYLRARFEAWRTRMSMQKVVRQMGAG